MKVGITSAALPGLDETFSGGARGDVLAGVLADGGATYTPGLSERRAGNTTYMHGGMKSAEARTSSAGAVSSTRVYDAFGQTVSGTGTWAGPGGYGGAFGYREDGTGLRLVGHRLYDPAAGRFVSRDPARDGGNWYAYCEGDPVNGADPTGLFVPLLLIAVIAGASWYIHEEATNPSEDETDPNGNPVRIGGGPGLINPPGNGQTYNGTIHFKDRPSYENYLTKPHWQDHEEGHIVQGITTLHAPLMALECGFGWLLEVLLDPPSSTHGPTGHDYAPFEMWAEDYADSKDSLGRP